MLRCLLALQRVLLVVVVLLLVLLLLVLIAQRSVRLDGTWVQRLRSRLGRLGGLSHAALLLVWLL